MDAYIKIDHVKFSYEQADAQVDQEYALDGISLVINKGEHLAILGRNGSGKSTLARLINGLEIPSEGSVEVAGFSTGEEEISWEVRRRCGMVFQNPDNQIVATTVEEDVAFGPENLGIPSEEIRERVDNALELVGLSAYAKRAPTELSGGQKQKLAIAGILAMQPECIILDEATSMLDPEGRKGLMDLVTRLREEQALTIINITHDMAEASLADRVVVLHQGRKLIEGEPRTIFHYVDEIREIGLDVPVHTAIVKRIADKHGIELLVGEAATEIQAEAALRRYFLLETRFGSDFPKRPDTGMQKEPETVVSANQISYTYRAESLVPDEAIRDISFDVERGEFFGIMGHSGSGKSTLISHLNGLLRLQAGDLTVLNRDMHKVKDIRNLRRHVQVLFQYPEHQLFADTVREDIAFGPRKLGVPEDKMQIQIDDACRRAGVRSEWMERSPFELSGGEKRRVALAGILAMKPEILILDEPAAGLDPAGREEVIQYLTELHEDGVTIIMVSHSMDDLARLADRILVLDHGRGVLLDRPAAIFEQQRQLESYRLSVPATKAFLDRFKDAVPELDSNQFTIETAAKELERFCKVKEEGEAQ